MSKAASVPDDDYMYFGYWLQSPEDPDGFAAFYNGELLFNVPGTLNSATRDEALTANYEGGAAGMYVTRKLRLIGQTVDVNSPGFFGRFTAKAALTAIFGGPNTVDENRTISGTITEFKDGNRDLDFKVTLAPLNILDDTGDRISATS